MNSRAVHLEVATSLETDCFNVFRRFINRRGLPKCIYSDNGSNFVGAEREITTAIEDWNQKQIQDELLQKGCQWVFQPPRASHASGVWERLIRSTRTALKAILGNSLVDEEVLTTVLTEVESILNSRPLSPASDDPNDCEPLTPNHLLLQRPVHTLPPGSFVKEDILVRKKWRQAQILADYFWKRWLKEYVPALQERPRRNAEVGDLVILVDEPLPRAVRAIDNFVYMMTSSKWRPGTILKKLYSPQNFVPAFLSTVVWFLESQSPEKRTDRASIQSNQKWRRIKCVEEFCIRSQTAAPKLSSDSLTCYEAKGNLR